MNHYDLHSEVVRALKARAGSKYSDHGSAVAHFCCVRHEDSTPSAWLGDNAWGCFTCTPQAESLRTLAGLLGIEVASTRSFPVEAYADKKKFIVSNLERWGVHTAVGKFGDDVTAIPYRDASGKTLRTRVRTAAKVLWSDDGVGTFLYGLDVLAKQPADAPVILVEGESDCHAAWHHGVLAIGVPGANVWRSDWAKELEGHPVVVWQEPDKGGAGFVRRVAHDIPNVRVASLDGVKDLADLHAASGKEFKAIVERCIASARPVGANPLASSFSPIIGATLDDIQVQKLKPVDAVPTPLPTWNAACRSAGGGEGLARGWHITIGANTGNGKSLLGLNLAATAIEAGEHVGFVTLEMSKEELATRLMSISSGVTAKELEQGRTFSVASWRAASAHLNRTYDRTGGVVYVNDRRLRDLTDVLDAIRHLHEINGVRFVILDYLQLVWIRGGSERDILARIQEVSGQVSGLAKDLGVVFVGLSQFNRQTSANRNDPPTPQGLMGGSPLENDSDQVLLLDHTQYERDHDNETATTRAILSKNRHGPMSIIPVRWDYRSLRLREMTGATSNPASSPTMRLLADDDVGGSAA